MFFPFALIFLLYVDCIRSCMDVSSASITEGLKFMNLVLVAADALAKLEERGIVIRFVIGRRFLTQHSPLYGNYFP